jgi:hypothetical protein
MAVTEDDLRAELGYSSDEWTNEDAARAETLIGRARSVVLPMVGRSRLLKAQADAESEHEEIAEDGKAKLAAIDEAVMEYVKLRFANPERVMQRRQGDDNSVSFSDSSEAAVGRREVKAIIRDAFGNRTGSART